MGMAGTEDCLNSAHMGKGGLGIRSIVAPAAAILSPPPPVPISVFEGISSTAFGMAPNQISLYVAGWQCFRWIQPSCLRPRLVDGLIWGEPEGMNDE